MELEAIEFVLQLSDLRTVSIHPFTGTVPILVHLVYDKSRITEHHEPFYTELNGDVKAMQSRLVLSGIIGGLEVDPEDIAQPVPRCEMKYTPAPAPSILREPSKYIFQCSGELSETGVFISVHSTIKSTSYCDLIVVRL
jgi:hypothetical protein